MNEFRFPIRLIGAAALFCAASAAHATFTFGSVATGGNSSTAAQTYQASVGGALDSFSDLTINSALGTNVLSRTAVYPGPVSYTVSTEVNLFTVQSPVIGGSALSVDGSGDTLTFSNFGGVNPVIGIRNFGASVYLSELTAGNAVAGSFSVTATDINNLSQTSTFAQGLSGNAGTLYFTLASTVALQSIQFAAIAPGTNVFATVDNVVLAPVPLPAAAWLLLTGMGGLGIFKRRRA